MTSRSRILFMVALASMACRHHSGTNCIPAPVATDAGAADSGSSVDAGSDVDAGDVDAGNVDAGDVDAGDIDAGDAGSAMDAGDAGDISSDAGADAGAALVMDAGEEDEEDEDICPPPQAQVDAGSACGGPTLGCFSNADCCSGVCILTGLPTCADCSFQPTPDGGTCNPSGNLVSEVVGNDGTCICDGGSFTTCSETCSIRGCPAKYTCNVGSGLCEPEPCSMGYTCPGWEFCNAIGGGDPHGCAPNSCTVTYGCGAGAACDYDAGLCQALQSGACE